MIYKTPSKELQTLFNQEWKRTKRLCKPFFDNKQKPALYVAKLRRCLGLHSGSDATYSQRFNGRWHKMSHRITIAERHLTSPDLINTIRHEVAHVLYRNHGPKFRFLLKGLIQN